MPAPPETQERLDTRTGRATGYPAEAEKMRRRITDEVDIPVHTRAVTIGHELKDAGMDKTTADTIGDGFEQVAVAVTGLSRVFADGFESFQQRIDDVKDELINRIDDVKDELINRIDDVKNELNKRIDDVKDELINRIDDVKNELNKRMDKLDARMDKMDEHNRQEHRANRVFMLGILALFTTVFLAVGGGMFMVLNSKIDANTAKIDKLDEKIDAVDAKVERILGILEGMTTQ